MIPQQFHWIWIGTEPLPERDRGWMASWKIHHPHWRCIVWAQHPENIELEGFEVRPLPPLINQRFYDGIEEWIPGRPATAARSDIMRYELVLRGGIYLDTDVECFGNIDHVLEGVSLFVAHEWNNSVGNYMFGAAPNHPAIYTVVRELGSHILSFGGHADVVEATGPFYLNEKLQKYPDLVIYPYMLFNPLSGFDDPHQVVKWPAISLANHYYDGKWYDRAKSPPPDEFLG